MWVVREWLTFLVSRFVCSFRMIVDSSSNPSLVCMWEISVIRYYIISASKMKLNVVILDAKVQINVNFVKLSGNRKS